MRRNESQTPLRRACDVAPTDLLASPMIKPDSTVAKTQKGQRQQWPEPYGVIRHGHRKPQSQISIWGFTKVLSISQDDVWFDAS